MEFLPHVYIDVLCISACVDVVCCLITQDDGVCVFKREGEREREKRREREEERERRGEREGGGVKMRT